jgi:hypothetical protein
MSAPLDHTGPLDAVEDPSPMLLVLLVARLRVREVEEVMAEVEVCLLE